jgi:hypothetical protein
MDLVKYILGEFSVIRGAPVAFVLSVVAVGLLIFYLMSWGFGRENSYLRTQLDDYKEKLKGATPQEASDRIKALEAAAAIAIGKKWPPLSPGEVASISTALRSYRGAAKIHIVYTNQYGQDLAKGLAKCFEDAGWKTYLNAAAVGDSGVVIGHGDNALAVKKIIEEHSALQLQLFKPVQPEMAEQIFINIGIKPG